MWLDFDVRASRRLTYSLNEALLWMMDLYFSWKQWFKVKNILMDLFLINTQLLSSQDVNWWTGVVWITCGLLWCFYQLFGLSFWRHPFTAEHPLLRHFSKSDEETNSSTSWMAWEKMCIFGWTLRLKNIFYNEKRKVIFQSFKQIFTVILQHWNTSSLQSTSSCCALDSIS